MQKIGKRTTLALCLALCLVLAMAAGISAEIIDSGTCGDNLTWMLDDEGTLTITGSGEMENYLRRDETPWYDSIDKIKTVTIGNSVTSIGWDAFSGCTSLTEVTIPNSVTSIGSSAFSGCTSLTNITIPNSVTEIRYGAFSYCSSLTKVTIPNSVTSIGGYAFSDCASLTSITIPNSVTFIGVAAFFGCTNLSNVTIPDGVKQIRSDAFVNCDSLTSIAIPKSVTSIGLHDPAYLDVFQTFAGRCLEAIYVDADNPYYCDDQGVLLNKTKTRLFSFPEGKTGFYTIPESVTWVNHDAFSAGNNLSSIYVDSRNPEYCADDGVLLNKEKTRLISFPGEKTGTYTIPSSVTEIDWYAFNNCSNLSAIYVAVDNLNYSDDAGVLMNKAKSKLIRCPGGKTGSYTIRPTVEEIEQHAFDGCSGLTSVTIPNSVTYIMGSFKGCVSLIAIHVDDGNPRYCDENGVLFNKAKTWLSRCPEGKKGDYVIPNGVTDISSGAFESCTGLTSITIPNGVTTIDSCLFSGCSSLTSITIPNSVTWINYSAFNLCDNLKDVYYGGTKAQWERVHITIGGNDPLLNATIHFNGTEEDIAVTDVTLDQPNLSVAAGSSATLTATVLPANATNKNVTWKSSDTAVATVSNGVVSALKEGEAVITVTTADGGKFANCTVKVGPGAIGPFSIDTDIFSFANARANFNGTYRVSDALFKKLCDAAEDVSGEPMASMLDRYRNSSWQGSCYGMAVAAALNQAHKIDAPGNFDAAADGSIFKMRTPKQHSGTEDVVNYYFLSQFIGLDNAAQYVNTSGFRTLMQDAAKAIEENKTVPFGYWFFAGGHEILLYGYEQKGDGSHEFLAYDNRYIKEAVYVRIPANFSSCAVVTPDGTENAYCVDTIDDLSALDPIDIDGPGNKLGKLHEGTQITAGSDSFTLKNDAGKTLRYDKGVISGDMEVYHVGMIAAGTADDGKNGSKVQLWVEDSDAFDFKTIDEEQAVSVTNANVYEDVRAKGADSIRLSADDGIKIKGSDYEYEASLHMDDTDTNLITVAGNADAQVTIAQEGSELKATGLSGKTEITSYSDHKYVHDKTVTAPKNGKLAVGVGGSEVVIKVEPDAVTVEPKEVTLKVGEKKTLKATLTPSETVNETLKWTGADPNVAEVANDGTVTAKGAGTTTVTVTTVNGKTATAKVTVTNPFQFDDVKDSKAFYYDAVYWAVDHKPQITTGATPTLFKPNDTCTRAQVVTFLWRAKGEPEPKSANNPFTDVKSNDYFYKAVLWAVENGVTEGMTKTSFGPKVGCTRGQVVTFLHRAEGKPAASGKNVFTDVKSGAYYYDAVLWAVGKDITKGTDATHFSPDKTCTRGQIVTFLYRDLTK